MAYLKLDQILKVDDTQYADVEVPEWGEDAKVCVRNMTTKEGMAFAANANDPKTSEIDKMLPVILNCTLSQPEGDPLFSTDTIRVLAEKNLKPVQRIFNAIVNISKPEEDPEKN